MYTGLHYSDINQEYFKDTESAFSSVSLSPDHAFAQLHVGPQNTQINFKIDTGRAMNILPHSLFKSLNISHPIEPPTHKLTLYTGNMIPVVGMIRVSMLPQRQGNENIILYSRRQRTPLLSLQSSVDLGLIKLTYDVESSLRVPPVSPIDKQLIEQEYGDLFKGIGVIPGEVKLHLKDNAVPVVNPPCRIPGFFVAADF